MATTAAVGSTLLDPFVYEIIRHRLLNIAEEGRIALQHVTASPIVVQGGECMSSFYLADGTTAISASGHLRFSAGTSDAIRAIIGWFGDEPDGILDGDQFFLNDPYICTVHTFDMTIVKPLFVDGRLVAWTGSMTHTADTGGLLRGQSTEIFHEGIRILGLKVIEAGRFRQDVFRVITQQCRDPNYVGMDIKSRIAANNVCAKGFLALVAKFGVDRVTAALEKMIADSETMARARLRELPDGIWRSRAYGVSYRRDSDLPSPFRIVCTMAKTGDALDFDLTGTSPQNPDDRNCTLSGTLGVLFVALTSQLFWNVAWNEGLVRAVRMVVPEGTLLNCRYPAATIMASQIGGLLTAAASECIARMLFAAGRMEDVNASWYGLGGSGGPGPFYGGTNQHGWQVGQGIYDMHGQGFGAAPYRDGVHTGGHINNPTVGISDIENIEMQYPLLYLGRNHHTDGGGFGKFQGGMGTGRVVMVYGSQNLTVDHKPYDGVPWGWGMFGGYAIGRLGERRYVRTREMRARLERGEYPTTLDEADGFGEWVPLPIPAFDRPHIPEYDLLLDPIGVGSGYGDPLDRDAARVAEDVRTQATSREVALRIYGVHLTQDGSVDAAATAGEREHRRRQRLAAATAPALRQEPPALSAGGRRVHEALELASDAAGRCYYRCRCGHVLAPAEANYKQGAARRRRPISEVTGWAPPLQAEPAVVLDEYYCPGCGVQLQVDLCSPGLDGDEPLWDMQLAGDAARR